MRRLVDIFSGCGGLSLGFDLWDGETRFRTVLGVDVVPSAVRLFNSNFSRLHGNNAPIARVADVCWFETVPEIQLYYLSHLAKVERNDLLADDLARLGYVNFLAALRQIDEACDDDLRRLTTSDDFVVQGAGVSSSTYSLAIVKRVLSQLALTSFTRPAVDTSQLPWSEEYADGYWTARRTMASPDQFDSPQSPELGQKLWRQATGKLTTSPDEKGKGQHAGNRTKYSSLARFVRSQSGKQLEAIVAPWLTQRRSLISQFCERNADSLCRIYGLHKADGLLGGPPCKGFSRIGRPVANSLRSQGVFAWTDDEFGDERNRLMLHYVLFLEALRPDFFVFENVSNFQSSLRTPEGILKADDLLAEAIASLSNGELNYKIGSRQVMASAHGIPQHRQRFFMVGTRSEISTCPPAALLDVARSPREITTTEAFFGVSAPHEFTQANSVTTATQAIFSRVLPPSSDPALAAYFEWIQIPIGEPTSLTDGHIYRRMRADDAAFFRYLGPGLRWMDWELKSSETFGALKQLVGTDPVLSKVVEGNLALRLILEETVTRFRLSEQHLLGSSYLKNRSGSHGDWLERLPGDRPAKTIVAHIGKDTYGYIHPAENRPITVREAARLQSFPDAFSFATAGVVDAYTAIGNAVPPLLARAIAAQIAGALYEGVEPTGRVVSLETSKASRRRR